MPGITGLWQISGRSNVDFDERVSLDVAYIENRSFWYDLKILWRTAGAILGQHGAC
jgi:lipopolysaccharide/colanic/teichoic acid biosynthesis glycosyltransferase